MNVTAAFPVTEASQVGECRRVVQWLADRLDFSDERGGRAALVVSELGTNLAKHAREGELLVRPLLNAEDDPSGIEVIAVDRGPGMTDPSLSRRDGHSTSGTLGHGLGAIERQADAVDMFTHTSGTVIAARIWREAPPPVAGRPRIEVGAVHVSKSGESVCGDGWTSRIRDARLALFVADGLGHGLAAHEAARAAITTFHAGHEDRPATVIADVHQALKPTRGAAVASLAVDLERETAVFAGIGNIGAAIMLPGGERRNLVSHNGTAGHTASRIQEFAYPAPVGSVIVMYSDGISGHWDLSAYPGLRFRPPSVIAAVLYRDFSRRRDDVTVVVAKDRTAVAEKL